MRCWRGLRTAHYIVRPRLTDYAAKICSFSLFAKPVLINFKKVYQNGYSIFEFRPEHQDNILGLKLHVALLHPAELLHSAVDHKTDHSWCNKADQDNLDCKRSGRSTCLPHGGESSKRTY